MNLDITFLPTHRGAEGLARHGYGWKSRSDNRLSGYLGISGSDELFADVVACTIPGVRVNLLQSVV